MKKEIIKKITIKSKILLIFFSLNFLFSFFSFADVNWIFDPESSEVKEEIRFTFDIYRSSKKTILAIASFEDPKLLFTDYKLSEVDKDYMIDVINGGMQRVYKKLFADNKEYHPYSKKNVKVIKKPNVTIVEAIGFFAPLIFGSPKFFYSVGIFEKDKLLQITLENANKDYIYEELKKTDFLKRAREFGLNEYVKIADEHKLVFVDDMHFRFSFRGPTNAIKSLDGTLRESFESWNDTALDVEVTPMVNNLSNMESDDQIWKFVKRNTLIRRENIKSLEPNRFLIERNKTNSIISSISTQRLGTYVKYGDKKIYWHEIVIFGPNQTLYALAENGELKNLNKDLNKDINKLELLGLARYYGF